MELSRRAFGVSLFASLGLPVAGTAHALDVDAALNHVDVTIDDIVALIVTNRPRDEIAIELRQILESRAALPQLAQFTAGIIWRSMSVDQRARFTAVFAGYMAHVYAGQFRRFEGSVEDLRAAIHVLRAEDAGTKGVLVRTAIRPTGQTPISIVWLVSDQSGKIAISDVLVEGISMAITQREIIGAMLEARRGNVDLLIDDLERQQTRIEL